MATNRKAPTAEARDRPVGLRVCIDARMEGGVAGGLEQVVIGLAAGLSGLSDGDEEYLFLTLDGRDGWLRPFLKGSCRVLPWRSSQTWQFRVRSKLSSCWPRLSAAYLHGIRLVNRYPVPPSDGTIEAAGVDLMHFTTQLGFLTGVPSIYHPHDLQHVHLPHMFSHAERRFRDSSFQLLCDRALMVGVTASWGRQDVMRHYGLPLEKVRVVPWAPIVGHYPQPDEQEINAVRQKYHLPETFVFYPAQTWPHKNHLLLIDALALLRERLGVPVHLVCSGRMTDYAAVLERHVRTRKLTGQVRFLGFVAPAELQALYGIARCVVIPSLFEAASFPLWEAFANGVPCACSAVTSLPEQAGDAALLFDPHDPSAIADCIWRLWNDTDLRRALSERGRGRVSEFSWDRTARTFRAHYRRLTGRHLTSDDRDLVNARARI